MPFVVRERVRWSDVDGAGIIYFGAYARLIEIAETELYRELGFPWSDLFERLAIWLPRVHLDMKFRAPARLDDALLLHTFIRSIGHSAIRLETIFRREADEALLADARMVTVCVDRATEKSRSLPPSLGEVLRRHVERA